MNRNCKLKSFQKKTKFQRLLKLDILSRSLLEKCAISCYLSILAQLHQLLLNITLRQATSNFALPAQSQSNISTRSALSYFKSSSRANLSATVKIVTLAKVPKPKISLCPQAVMVLALAPWTFQSPLPAASNKQCVLTREDTQVMVMVIVMVMSKVVVMVMLNIQVVQIKVAHFT